MTDNPVCLRKPVESDAPFIVWLDTPDAVREHVLMAAPPTLEQATHVIGRWLTFDDPYGYFIIETGTENTPVGWVHAKPCVHINGAVELGWRLHPEFWGNGLATTAARNLIAMFRERDSAVVFTATTLTANIRSQRVMRRLGMTLLREYLHDDIHPAQLYWLPSGPAGQ
ncbi:MAG: GNAT family N-acetyltransferase [Armatimonadota bacterium]